MRGGAAAYAVRRLILVAPGLLAVLSATFVLIHLAPGSPVVYLAGEQSSREYQAELAGKFGLDQPLPQQYVTYVSTLLRGDLGRSIVQGRPVTAVLADRIPATLLLVLPALLVSALVGIGVGLVAARSPGAVDRGLTVVLLLGQAVPVFVVGLLSILVFAVYLGVLPVAGMRDLRESYTGWAAALDVGRHMLLPVLTLAAGHAAVMARLTRAGVREEEARQHPDELRRPHQQVVEGAPDDAGAGADHQPQEGGDRAHAHSDQEGRARAVDHLHRQVAAQVVRAHRRREGGGLQHPGPRVEGSPGRDHRRQQGERRHRHQVAGRGRHQQRPHREISLGSITG